MSADDLTETFYERINRGRFLKKLGVGAVAALGFFGITSSAAGYTWACCGLCAAPTSCSYTCGWCWPCCTSTNAKFNCCEGYEYAGDACSNGNCGPGWVCSFVQALGRCISAPPQHTPA